MNLQDAILDNIETGTSTTFEYNYNGAGIQGQSVSFLKNQLLGMGFKKLGGTENFVNLCENLGFKVLDAKNSRNQKARIVTL